MSEDDALSGFHRVFDRSIAYFSNLKRRIVYGQGDCKVTPLQQLLLNAFLPTLNAEIHSIIEQQLSKPYKISFFNDGRISPFYFKNPKLTPELLIPDPAFSDRLYKVEMFVDGLKQHAHVTFFEGRIFSIEFKKPFSFYKGKDIRFGVVTLGNSKGSFTESMDRHEHGKDGRHATGED
jgi:hypothetical protein